MSFAEFDTEPPDYSALIDQTLIGIDAELVGVEGHEAREFILALCDQFGIGLADQARIEKILIAHEYHAALKAGS